MQQLQSHTPLPFSASVLPFSPIHCSRGLTHCRLLISVYVHVCVRLHTTEKQPCSVMTPAEAQLIEPGLSALTGWPVKYGHYFSEAAVCDSPYRYQNLWGTATMHVKWSVSVLQCRLLVDFFPTMKITLSQLVELLLTSTRSHIHPGNCLSAAETLEGVRKREKLG